MNLTRAQRSADAYLRQQGTDIVRFVLDRDDLEVPGEAIARQLREATRGVTDVSGQTVRDWIRQFRQDDAAAVAP